LISLAKEIRNVEDAIIFAIRRINYDRQDNTTVGVVKIA
jgi:hypothetical protein